MNHIGEKIKELRRKNDMTQEKLADYLCVTYQTVSKWETGVTSPDLSLIVPLARLFKVTTDEIFGYSESVEDLTRADLQRRYDETFKTGDISVRMSVAEEAVRAYPGDMEWLNRYAEDIWCDAISTADDTEFNVRRDRAIELFKKVIENCENDEIKCNAIVSIVGCLNGKGNHDEANRYAQLYPDTKISAEEKAGLLISCMTGEERVIAHQDALKQKTEKLVWTIIHGDTTRFERDAAKGIIDALVPDGNYLTFHNELYAIDLSEAREYIRGGDLDRAMLAMFSARRHAEEFDKIKGEYMFTAPLLNRVKYNTDTWYQTGTGTMVDDLKALLDFSAYSPLKAHRDYAELIK